MGHSHDKVFFVNFGMVLGALFAIFFVCIGAARLLDDGSVYEDGGEKARLAERIKPIGIVVTDPAVLVAMAPVKPKREPYTGAQVVTNLCGGCHAAGVSGAPKIGDHGAWAARASAAGGFDGLVQVAIKGKLPLMPARGGDPSLSDEEVRAAVEVMAK